MIWTQIQFWTSKSRLIWAEKKEKSEHQLPTGPKDQHIGEGLQEKKEKALPTSTEVPTNGAITALIIELLNYNQ